MRPSCRYSGRKSCPHWLMQCASSTAMKLTWHLDRRFRKPSALPDKTLRRHVQKAEASFAQAADDRRLVLGAQRTVVERGGNAVADERVDLVLHQGNQGRYDHRQT